MCIKKNYNNKNMERDHSNEDLLLPLLIVKENANVLIVDRSGIFGQFSIISPHSYTT